MELKFPFIPKSNARLRPGLFWPIHLSNGKYACGIILDVPKDKKSHGTRMVYIGLLNWVGEIKPTSRDLERSRLKVLTQGHAHIKTIVEQKEALEGFIDPVKNNLEIESQVGNTYYSPGSQILKGFDVIGYSTAEDHEQLKTQSTWGYSVIIIEANRLLVDHIAP